LKAQLTLSIHEPQPVRPQGRTPVLCQKPTSRPIIRWLCRRAKPGTSGRAFSEVVSKFQPRFHDRLTI